MSFLYYAPCQRHAISEVRKEIAYAFDSEGGPVRECHPGPDERPGIVFGDGAAWSGRENKVGHYPETQTWHQIPKSEIWIGYYELPTPDELARPKQLRGLPVELADGNQWLVPVARNFVESEGDYGFVCALPSARKFDGEKWMTNGPIPKYRLLWEIATNWAETISPSYDGNATVEDECEGCVDVLSVNYRVHRAEISVIGLLTEESRGEIISAALDLQTFLDWSKKNETSAGTNS